MELVSQISPVTVTGETIYHLQLNPSEGFIRRMQAYTNYLFSLHPALDAFTQTWTLFQAGTDSLPMITSMVNVVPRNDGSRVNECTTTFHYGESPVITMDPSEGLFPHKLQSGRWYTIKVYLYASDGLEKPSWIPKECESISLSYKVSINKGRTHVSVSDGNKIIKDYTIMPEHCMDYNDRSQQLLSNWKQNGNIASITYQSEPSEHQFYIRFLDDDKESIAFNNADFNGNWLTKYSNQCACFDYRIKYDAFVEPGNSYVPFLYIYTGNKNLENTENSWDKDLLYAKFISTYNNVNNQWKHYCFPIRLCSGRLPFNEYGRWEIQRPDSCALWDSLIQHVSGLIIPTDYNRATTEEISFDNFCTTNCNDSYGKQDYAIPCLEIEKNELASITLPVTESAGTFHLNYKPTTAFNNKLQAYTSYIQSLYPGLQSFNPSWEFTDAGTGALPLSPNKGASLLQHEKIKTDGLEYAISPTLKAGRWYNIEMKIVFTQANGTAAHINNKCKTTTFSYRLDKVNGKIKATIR